MRELYDLSGVSGKTVMDHPETKRMLADIRSGHITGPIFSKLARNTRELLDFAEIFQQRLADNGDSSARRAGDQVDWFSRNGIQARKQQSART